MTRRIRSRVFLWTILASAALCAPANAQSLMSTSFTYQGHLKSVGVPVSGTVHLRFSLWNHATDSLPANQVGASMIASPVSATDGLFTVDLDFGAAAFNGDARWLAIEVCTDGTCAVTTPLTPRQRHRRLKILGLFRDVAKLSKVTFGQTAPK